MKFAGIFVSACILILFLGLILKVSGAAVGIEVTYDVSSCPTEAPLLVVATNRLPISLRKHGFVLSATHAGYSEDVRSTYVSSDKILGGLSSEALCWPTPYGGMVNELRYERNPERKFEEEAALVWSAKVSSAQWAGGISYYE